VQRLRGSLHRSRAMWCHGSPAALATCIASSASPAPRPRQVELLPTRSFAMCRFTSYPTVHLEWAIRQFTSFDKPGMPPACRSDEVVLAPCTPQRDSRVVACSRCE
jgi:hypothetical protein